MLRTDHSVGNPVLADLLVRFLSRSNVELTDADKGAVIAAIFSSQNASPRRIPDAILSAAARQARVDFIATFDQKMTSAAVPVRVL